MFRLILLLLVLGGCTRAEPTRSTYQRENDPMYQEIKKLVQDRSDCFSREAQSKSLAKVDLDTAALAVMARCALERQRYKAFSARHTIEHPPQFEVRWRAEEADAVIFIKQILALVRTN